MTEEYSYELFRQNIIKVIAPALEREGIAELIEKFKELI